MTDYCCKVILGESWIDVATKLNKFIKDKAYTSGTTYIDSLDIEHTKKLRLMSCFLSYAKSC